MKLEIMNVVLHVQYTNQPKNSLPFSPILSTVTAKRKKKKLFMRNTSLNGARISELYHQYAIL